MTTFKIESEADAWRLLQEFVDAKVDLHDAPQFDFASWPELTVYLPTTPIEGSISTTMMAAFIELQKAIHRSYQLVSSNTDDLRALSATERERLEIRVKVEKGSSEYDIDLTQIVERIGSEAIGKMDATTIGLTVLGVALIIGGALAWKAWLNHKAEIRKAELASVEKHDLIGFQTAMIASGTENMRLLADAMQRQPLLGDVEAAAEPARQQLLKSIADEGGGRAYETELTAGQAREIASQKRQQSESIRLAGNYRVQKVDTSAPDGFRVTLRDDSTGQELSASMQDALISEQHKKAIQEAEWRKQPVYVELSAKKLRNRIVDAIVLSASAAKEGREVNLLP